MATKTLQEAILYFSNEITCIQFLAKVRWPDGAVRCPRCGSEEVSWIESRKVWQCKACQPRRQFSVKVGTILEDSPIPLAKWLPAVWLIASAKNGISSYELARALDVTQKTAWFMLHRIRAAMHDDSEIFTGKVEVNETLIGGKARFMRPDKRKRVIMGAGSVGKVAVMGLLMMHGPDGESRVQTQVVKNTKKGTLTGKVRRWLATGSEVFTDALKSYDPERPPRPSGH